MPLVFLFLGYVVSRFLREYEPNMSLKPSSSWVEPSPAAQAILTDLKVGEGWLEMQFKALPVA